MLCRFSESYQYIYFKSYSVHIFSAVVVAIVVMVVDVVMVVVMVVIGYRCVVAVVECG